MKLNYKRSIRLVILLASSLLIASVSASMYYTMYMNATVKTITNEVMFTPGNDYATTGGSITNNNQTVTFAEMNGAIGGNTTYTDPVRIHNTDSKSHTVELELSSWTGTSSTPLYNITIHMYNYANNTSEGNSIVLTPSGAGEVPATGLQTIPADTLWRVQWEIYWEGTANASSSVTVDLQLIVSS